MNKKIFDLLRESAWYEGREKDIAYLYDELSSNNLSKPNEIVFKFLAEFNNVFIKHTTLDNRFIEVHFDLEGAIEITHLELLAKIEKVITENLVPIGYIGDYEASLLMSYSGRVYMMLEDEGFFELGQNWEDALETILEQKEFKNIFSFR
ncbi:SUKH-3 domain-containing protein [Taibaiella chishuiensis]|uniref:SUKH-3 immunity protein of toxin-antitoxin system n=1 Tax=Taibaiella chishuiensis TaxID=1434707 RepID=A0A2P8D7C5_9BACT|nr:SUKH-3 domain-containing protein [Taibaiella chishuiensis]PSK93130.1 SUKH-3 immunity protein of toxin-antitoxin system [Taibaiella chishuiensis]